MRATQADSAIKQVQDTRVYGRNGELETRQIIECSVGRERGQGTAAEDKGVVEHRNTLAPTEQVPSAQGARWNIPGLGLSTAASHTTHLCFSRATQHKNRNCSTAGLCKRGSNVAVTAKTSDFIVSTECDTSRC